MARASFIALAAIAAVVVLGATVVTAADAAQDIDLDTTVPHVDASAGIPTSAGASADEELEVEDHTVHYDPKPTGFFFVETFQGEDPIDTGRVVKSSADKYVHQMLKVDTPSLYSGIAGDKGLVAAVPAKHYGASLPFPEDFAVGPDDDFVLQYEVRLQQGLECGGAYLKLPAAAPGLNLKHLHADTPYVVMFGPDKCGATNKVHFILRHQNPVTSEWVEHHLKTPPMPKSDKHSHLYTLHVRKDNTFDIKVDDEAVFSGSLFEDMEPPINPPKMIPDPEDEKPDDWVDEAQIPDPEATKPDDWDEDAPALIPDESAVKPEGWLDDAEEYIPDPEAEMPEDWDEEEDGDYEAPLVPNSACEEAPGCGEWVRPMLKNPEYKGKWEPPMIDNPEYQGEWAPREIPNPAYFVDEDPHQLFPMAGVAIEIWTMSGGLFFDNVLVTRDAAKASEFAQQTWKPRHAAQVAREEIKRARIARAQREEAYETGGLMGKVNFFVLEAMDVAVANPIPSLLTIVVAFVSVIYLCCSGGGSDGQRRRRPTYRAPSAALDSDGKTEGDGSGDAGADAATATQDSPVPDDNDNDGDVDADEGESDDDEDEDESDDGGDDDDTDDDDGEGEGDEDIPQPTASPRVRKRTTRRIKRSGD